MPQMREKKTQRTPMYNTRRLTAVLSMMKLTDTERERITDSVLKIQSVRASLDHVEESKIPKHAEIDECLESVDVSLRQALGYIRCKDAVSSEEPLGKK